MKKKWNCYFFLSKKRWRKSYWLMRNFIILFFALNLGAFANGRSQVIALTNYENTTLLEIFEDVKVKTGYGILYKMHEINPDVRVSMNKENSNVNEILDEALDKTGLTYKVQDEVIVIFKADAPLPLKTFEEQISKKKVKGVVVDESGMSLPGATILEKGTQNGVITNMDGEFSLEVKNDNAVLQVSYIGYQIVEVSLETEKLRIVLKSSSSKLNEVIAIGYGSAKKKDMLGAVTRISSKVISESASTDIGSILQGKASGLQVLSGSGAPGENVRLRIRGEASLGTNNDPLIVIDDVPMHEGFNLHDINPQDVENIDILIRSIGSCYLRLQG